MSENCFMPYKECRLQGRLISVATVQLCSTRLGFTNFDRDTASKAEPSSAPGDWLYATWL
jgi:hypothetical protein